MDKQPEALRLADEADHDEWIASTHQWREEASIELRRLHQANQELRESVKKANAQAEHFEWLWYLRGDVNQELVEALKYHQEKKRPIQRTIDLLAKHKEQE